MPLVHASIAPHSPVLFPSIGGEKTIEVADTVKSMQEVEGNLYVAQPDTLIVISPHAVSSDEAFSVNLSPDYTASFSEFGDTETILNFNGDIALASKVRGSSDRQHPDMPNVEVKIVNQAALDHGTAVTLRYLTEHVEGVKIVPVSTSQLSIEEHFKFGTLLRQVANESNKRIAIVASAELSHALRNSSEGYDPAGETFDAKIQELVTSGQLSEITKLNLDLVQSAKAIDGQRSLAILFGALDDLGYEAQILSYQNPFGIGLLVAEFSLI